MMELGLTRSLALAPFGPNGRNRWPSRGHRGGFATPGADTAAELDLAHRRRTKRLVVLR